MQGTAVDAEPATEPEGSRAAGERPRPLGAYALLIGLYNLTLGALVLWLRRHPQGLPDRFEATDLVLVGVATHKASRLITKDKVTAPVREPFTAFQQRAGRGEVEERPVGSGVRYAIGELLVCPYCIAQWLATTFLAGLVALPRFTRLISSIFAVVTISDFLQIAYRRADDG